MYISISMSKLWYSILLFSHISISTIVLHQYNLCLYNIIIERNIIYISTQYTYYIFVAIQTHAYARTPRNSCCWIRRYTNGSDSHAARRMEKRVVNVYYSFPYESCASFVNLYSIVRRWKYVCYMCVCLCYVIVYMAATNADD